MDEKFALLFWSEFSVGSGEFSYQVEDNFFPCLSLKSAQVNLSGPGKNSCTLWDYLQLYFNETLRITLPYLTKSAQTLPGAPLP